MILSPPPEWTNDNLSNFIENCRENFFATFVKLKKPYKKLVDIDDTYLQIEENLNNSNELLSTFFIFRAHSSYRTACYLAGTGQVPETYSLLRSCMEYSLYGHYFVKNPTSQEIWIKRHDNEKSKKMVRNEFTIGKMLDALTASDKKIAQVASSLYDQTIDCGAHPNILALSSILKINHNNDTDEVEFNLSYSQGGTQPHLLVLKDTARIGICCLDIFKIFYFNLFKSLCLIDKIERLKDGL